MAIIMMGKGKLLAIVNDGTHDFNEETLHTGNNGDKVGKLTQIRGKKVSWNVIHLP